MKKKKPKLHFQQVPLKKVEKLLEKKSATSGRDSELSVERPTPKTEPYSMTLTARSKTSR